MMRAYQLRRPSKHFYFRALNVAFDGVKSPQIIERNATSRNTRHASSIRVELPHAMVRRSRIRANEIHVAAGRPNAQGYNSDVVKAVVGGIAAKSLGNLGVGFKAEDLSSRSCHARRKE